MSYRKPLPSVGKLQSLFSYDPETGILWRKGEQGMQVAGGSASNGYLRTRAGGEQYAVHRIIWKMVHGVESDDIDHINGERKDNRIANLRLATRSDNNRNIVISPMNTSGYSGVTYLKREKRWKAYLKVEKTQVCAGLFKEKREAVIAYNHLALRLHGDFAHRKVNANIEKYIEEFGAYP